MSSLTARAYSVLERMTSVHAVDIKRESVTRSTGGAAIKNWTTDARGELPKTDVKCRRQAITNEEAIAAGVTSGKKTWILYFHEDPSIDKRDRVFFTDGVAVVAEVVSPSYQLDSSEQLWECTVTEFGPAK